MDDFSYLVDQMPHKRVRFVQEYCIDWNGTQAAIRAGYSPKTAQEQASRLLSNAMVQKAIEQRKQDLAELAELDASWVLKHWKAVADADSNELTQVRRCCCRFCHGVGHQYQWTQNEFMAAVDRALKSEGKLVPPDGLGGFGYDENREPHPDCPECFGNGHERVHIADTRKLKGNAKALYAGVQRTKDGVKVLMRDKDAAVANISKYLGMLVERKEISGPDGKPLSLVNLKADELSDEQLAAILGEESDGNNKERGGG